MKVYLVLIRCYFKVLSVLAPRLAAYQAFRLFQRPMSRMIKPLEKAFFDQARRFKIEHTPEDIDCFELGNKEGSLVILVHGWESNAGSMSAIATTLADLGFRVILFNLPAHGESKLKSTNILNCSKALDQVLKYYQYSGKPSIISHSFGSAVTTYTLYKYQHAVNRFIMLSTPDRIVDIFHDFKNTIGLGNDAFQELLQAVQEILNEQIDKIAVNELTSKIDYEELSIIHDQYDKVLPYQYSQNVYNKSDKANLTTFEKVGHYRMLWNESVIKTIVSKINQNPKNAA